MSDNSKNSGGEQRTISEQKQEIDYLKSKFHVEFPGLRSNEIEAAIEAAKKESNAREKIEARIRKILENAAN